MGECKVVTAHQGTGGDCRYSTTYSEPQHKVEVSGKPHALATSPLRKEISVSIMGVPQSRSLRSGEEKFPVARLIMRSDNYSFSY